MYPVGFCSGLFTFFILSISSDTHFMDFLFKFPFLFLYFSVVFTCLIKHLIKDSIKQLTNRLNIVNIKL